MEIDEIRKLYYGILSELSLQSGKTVEELDIEISQAIENCKDIEDILIKSAGVI